MRILRYISALGLGLGLSLTASAALAQEAEFKLIVNASNGVSALTQDEVSQLFLKKKTAWPGGQAVAPVDQAEESAVRRAFSKAVLRKDVGAVKSYWQTQIFSGRGVPPPEKSSDAAVMAFVEATAGAIGYVSADTAIGKGAKQVKVN